MTGTDWLIAWMHQLPWSFKIVIITIAAIPLLSFLVWSRNIREHPELYPEAPEVKAEPPQPEPPPVPAEPKVGAPAQPQPEPTPMPRSHDLYVGDEEE